MIVNNFPIMTIAWICHCKSSARRLKVGIARAVFVVNRDMTKSLANVSLYAMSAV
jgi:hypothetical protein